MRLTPLRSISLFSISAILLFCVAGTARAGTATSISGLYATGVSTQMVNGSERDGNWDITNKIYGGYVVTSGIPSTWATTTNGTKWISYSSNGLPAAPTAPATTYAYTLTFTINGTGNTGDLFSNVSITLTLAVDDSATISVNGTSTGLTVAGYSATKRLVLNSSNSNFKQGTNTLTVYVANSGGSQTGLLVSSIGGVVPEVGTWIPVLGALTLVGWMRLRPTKRQPSASA